MNGAKLKWVGFMIIWLFSFIKASLFQYLFGLTKNIPVGNEK